MNRPIAKSLQAGMQLHKSGRLAEAEAAYRDCLSHDPANPEILNLLGMVLHGQGRFDESIDAFRSSIERQPHQAAAYNNLGNVLFAGGRAEEAIDAYLHVISVNPGHLAARFNLGNAYLSRGRYTEACTGFKQALQIDPGRPELYYSLGITLHKMGNCDAAVGQFEAALQINPGFAEALYGICNVRFEQGRFQEALEKLRHMLDLHPQHTAARLLLARLYKSLGQRENEESAWRSVLALAPDNPDAICGLAEILKYTGQVDELRALIERGVGQYPDHALLNVLSAEQSIRERDYDTARDILLGTLKHANDEGAGILDVAESDRECNRAEISRRERAWLAPRIHYQLGRIYDFRAEYDKAYRHYGRGNELTRATLYAQQFDKRRYLSDIDRLLRIFTERGDPCAATEDLQSGEGSPVFLVGFPRSGTTLLDQILDAHHRFQTMEEPDTITAVEAALSGMTDNYTVSPASLAAGQLDELRRVYFEECDRTIRRESGKILVDKMPLNLVKAGVINLLFPRARYIFALRHPCDVCLSCFMQNFEQNDAMASFYTPEDAARLYNKVMEAWQTYRGFLRLDVHVVRYEDVIDDFEPEVSRLLDFTGAGWDAQVSEFHDHARRRQTIRTPSYTQVMRPLYRDSVYRWKHYGRQLEETRRILRPWISLWGYDDV